VRGKNAARGGAPPTAPPPRALEAWPPPPAGRHGRVAAPVCRRCPPRGSRRGGGRPAAPPARPHRRLTADAGLSTGRLAVVCCVWAGASEGAPPRRSLAVDVAMSALRCAPSVPRARAHSRWPDCQRVERGGASQQAPVRRHKRRGGPSFLGFFPLKRGAMASVPLTGGFLGVASGGRYNHYHYCPDDLQRASESKKDKCTAEIGFQLK